MSKNLKLFAVAVGVFLLFVLFSYIVHKDLLTQFDFDMTVRLQDRIPRRLDDLFSYLSLIGRFEFMMGLLVIIIIVSRSLWAVAAFVTFGFLHVLEIYGKYFVDHLPPPQFMLRTKEIGDFPMFHVRAENSYPSGHAARAAFMSIIIAFLIYKTKWLGKYQKIVCYGVLIGYDLLMFVSRPYLGEHWSTDVIGGLLLGGSMALFATAVPKMNQILKLLRIRKE